MEKNSSRCKPRVTSNERRLYKERKKMTPNQLLKYMTFFYFFFNIYLSPLLAQSFSPAQGVCLPDTGYVLSYIEDVRTGKNNAVIAKKNRQNTKPRNIQNKANSKPIQSQTKPIFWRSNPILSPKMRIFDKFMKTFLCKTKPNYVIGIQIAVEYELSKNTKNAKRTQS